MWTQNIVFQKILSKEKYNTILVGTFMIIKENYSLHTNIPGMAEVRKFFFTYNASMKLNKGKCQRSKWQRNSIRPLGVIV